MSRFRPAAGRLASLALLALVAAQCAQSPTAPSSTGSALSRGAVPQSGPPPSGDSLGTINALGATRFVTFGDSITWGTLSSFDGAFLFDPGPGTSYPYMMHGQLEATFSAQDFTVDNHGQPGERATQAVSSGRFQQTMAQRRPQGVILLEGINDLNGGVSIGEVVGALQQMVEIARLYNATVLVSTMFQTCRSENPSTGQIRENSAAQIVPFNNAVKAMAAGRQNVYVADLYAAFGNHCGPDGGVNRLGADGLHPTVSGYAAMASFFANVLRERFPVRGSFQ